VPGISGAETNVFTVLDRDDFHAATEALLGSSREAFSARYKFDIAPTTDDRPYFFHFFKWRTLPELLELRTRGGLPPLDWGYPVLVVALIQAVVFSLLLIMLPLALAGWLLAIFHWAVASGLVPERVTPCSQGVPCSVEQVIWFGFLTLPMLSVLAFSLIIALLLLTQFKVPK
jgi:hypothetical protein